MFFYFLAFLILILYIFSFHFCLLVFLILFLQRTISFSLSFFLPLYFLNLCLRTTDFFFSLLMSSLFFLSALSCFSSVFIIFLVAYLCNVLTITIPITLISSATVYARSPRYLIPLFLFLLLFPLFLPFLASCFFLLLLMSFSIFLLFVFLTFRLRHFVHSRLCSSCFFLVPPRPTFGVILCFFFSSLLVCFVYPTHSFLVLLFSFHILLFFPFLPDSSCNFFFLHSLFYFVFLTSSFLRRLTLQ